MKPQLYTVQLENIIQPGSETQVGITSVDVALFARDKAEAERIARLLIPYRQYKIEEVIKHEVIA